MNDHEPIAGGSPDDNVLMALDGLSDDMLREVLTKAGEILEQRAKAEQEKALQEIQNIAKAHGLNVSVGAAKKKRGRPAKKS